MAKIRQTLINFLAKESQIVWLMIFSLSLIVLILFGLINDHFKFLDYRLASLVQAVFFLSTAFSFLNFFLIGYYNSASNNHNSSHRLTQVIRIYLIFTTLIVSLIALELPKAVFLNEKSQHETIHVVWWENHYQPSNELHQKSNLALKTDKVYKFAFLCQQNSPDIGYNATTFKLTDVDGGKIFLQTIEPVTASKIFYFRREFLQNLGFDVDQDRHFDYTNHRKYAWVSHAFYVPHNGHYVLSVDIKTIFDNEQINPENLGCRTSGLFLIDGDYQNWLNETHLSFRFLFVATSVISFLLLMLSFFRAKNEYLDL